MTREAGFSCSECGASSAKWIGRCPECGAWNSYVAAVPAPRKGRRPASPARSLSIVAVEETPAPRLATGLADFDRVLGGGLVPGSVVLIGGEPGIGK